jgi:uncharacterized protein
VVATFGVVLPGVACSSPQDKARARSLFEEACTGGNATACVYVGDMFDKGEGGPRDQEQAVRWYEKAAEQGDKVAIAKLEEQRRKVDSESTSDTLTKLAAIDRELAKLRDEKKELQQEDTELRRESADLKRESADLDREIDQQRREVEQTQRELEQMERELGRQDEAFAAYNTGDFETAYREALSEAQAGESWAQAMLGVMYARGQGVPRDYAEAARWYRKAAEQGQADAQLNLGWMYFLGQGVEQHPGEAGR